MVVFSWFASEICISKATLVGLFGQTLVHLDAVSHRRKAQKYKTIEGNAISPARYALQKEDDDKWVAEWTLGN